MRATEALRPPVLAERALAGADLRRASLTYLLERTTARLTPGAPSWRRAPPRRASRATAQDPERQLARVLTPPAARSYLADAWASVDPATPTACWTARRERPAPRSSRAPDASATHPASAPRRPSTGPGDGVDRALAHGDGRLAELAAARPATVRRLRLVAPRERVRVVARVALSVDGRPGPALAVDARGPRRAPGSGAGAPVPPDGAAGALRARDAGHRAPAAGGGKSPRSRALGPRRRRPGAPPPQPPAGAARARRAAGCSRWPAAAPRAPSTPGDRCGARVRAAAGAGAPGHSGCRDCPGALRVDLLRLRSPAARGTRPGHRGRARAGSGKAGKEVTPAPA